MVKFNTASFITDDTTTVELEGKSIGFNGYRDRTLSNCALKFRSLVCRYIYISLELEDTF
jgi:hypothetical protein